MDKSRISILVVDDERGLCAGVQEALRREGYTVDAANDALTGLRLIGERLYNLVVTDIKMPEMTGLQLMKEARQKSRDTIFILMTAYGTIESAVEAMKEGAYDYLSKPLDMQRLRALVLKALEFQAVVAENNELRLRLQKRADPSLLVGNSEEMRRIAQLVDEVARSEVTVLIEGESGTGKEIVARSIHLKSPRSEKPFISVNCAALPEQLLEAELFGHVKGAFTGAVADKPGRFQLADGGTLFLDEIGDLSAKGQGDLLRVLEDGTFRMVGGTKLTRVNVRVVAATNKNLQATVTAGKFREDLLYRLQIVPVVIPPLRERAEDIPLLVESFLEHFTAKHKRRRKKLSPEAMQLCQRFQWPGNVRQLRNMVERLVITCKDSVINVADLPDFLRAHDQNATTFTVRPGMSLEEVEKLLIRQTLTHVTSNREEAAKRLGISRRSLQYKLKQYGLLDETEAGEKE
ncbi:MAG TPA: sigma-54 dependent transcriptional regulator [Candidatus Paceibacterota bacterium]|nr:sigma-54 dependent transcriptional regulator [Candidatus Paceibacterota bacterium]